IWSLNGFVSRGTTVSFSLGWDPKMGSSENNCRHASSFPVMEMLGSGTGQGAVMGRRFGAERMDGDSELAQSADVMTNQALPLSLVRRGLARFLIGSSRRERPVDHHRQRVRDPDQG